MKNYILFIMCILMISMCGCSGSASSSAAETESEESVSVSDTDTSESEAETAEEQQEEIYTPSESDYAVAEFFTDYITDDEDFPDKLEYQYYARTLGLDKDYFLNPEMWEVFYNKDIININSDIDEKEIYLIRLNPYKLLDVYAENNNCTVDDICEMLSVTKEQLYYNWGYSPSQIDYFNRHKDKEVSYSEEEKRIFGQHNGEDRKTVMSTHMIVIDNSDDKKKEYISYKNSLYEKYEIYRRDTLFAYTDTKKMGLYSLFSEQEKSPAFRVNGIGIRAVIPLSMPNAYTDADKNSVADVGISVMVNVSPFAYGCTDADKLDLMGIINAREQENSKKK